MNRIPAETFLHATEGPILDVRSPSEYEAGHIPGAISFPLFTDEERAVIGTAYKQESRQKAVKIGLEVFGPNMMRFIEEAEKLGSQNLRIYCWRGGMRSESMSWLLKLYGFKTSVLEEGYKAFRNYLHAYFQKKLNLKIITGYTGTGKTLLLHKMAEQGAQVIDLEGLANHQGSSFGNQKSTHQPTTEQFHNLLLQAFQGFDGNKSIWIEDESMRIGDVNLPESLFLQMQKSPHVLIESSREFRLSFLVKDYEMLSKEQWSTATQRISKRLGQLRTKEALEFIEAGDLYQATDRILPYYDKLYKKSIDKKLDLIENRFQLQGGDFEKLAKEILTTYR